MRRTSSTSYAPGSGVCSFRKGKDSTARPVVAHRRRCFGRVGSPKPRVEPIITFGGLARLHLDFGWPTENIGAQSPDSAFDIVAYSNSSSDERIAGEVKKTKREVDRLLELMAEYCSDPSAVALVGERGRNAFKKVEGLRARKAPIFWALGPAGYSRAFSVSYQEGGSIGLEEVDSSILMWPSQGPRA